MKNGKNLIEDGSNIFDLSMNSSNKLDRHDTLLVDTDTLDNNVNGKGCPEEMATSRFSYGLEGDVVIDPGIDDNFGLLYDCSSSRFDSPFINLFGDDNTIKGKNITDALSFVTPIGKGVYGDVYKAYLRNDPKKLFAVKRVQTPRTIEKIFGLEQNIIKELHALRSLKRPHVNIVRLYDYCSAIEINKQENDTDGKTVMVFYLIFELCDMDLCKFVKQVSENFKPHEIHLLNEANNHFNDKECKIQDFMNYSRNHYIKNKLFKDKIPLPALNEDIAKVIMYQLLQGLSYLHSNRIIHRDIKPQNILLKKNHNSILDEDDQSTHTWKVKISDLGLSTVIPARYLSLMTEEVVTLLYRPPELLLGNCECLLGKPMFRGRTEFSVLMRIITTVGTPPLSELSNLSKEMKYLSNEIPHMERDAGDTLRKIFTDHFGRQLLSDCGIDLFSKMLQFLPKDRISADDALRHPWFDNIKMLLKPSIAKYYFNDVRLFPRGYKDMLPLTFLGDVKEFKKTLKDKKKKWNNITIDDYITQFTFP